MTAGRWAIVVFISAVALTAVPGAAVAATQTPAEIERRTDALAGELRCPVCQQLSVRDSPSRVAQTFRERIRELVAEGRSDADVRAFFVARYGDWILLSPPRRGIGLAVWLIPPVVLAAGVALVVIAVRRWTLRAARLARAGAARPDAVASVRGRVEAIEKSMSIDERAS